MKTEVQFWSYFKELTGCSETAVEIAEGSTLGMLLEELFRRFPKLREMQRSMLVAVGVEYQTRDYILREGEKVSLFPPVQGG